MTIEDCSRNTQFYGMEYPQITNTPDNRVETYNGETVEYDRDGNMTRGPLNGVMADFEYDSQNRLLKAGTSTYRYDAEDNLIESTENGIKTSYVVNPNASLSQVMSKTAANGQTTWYIYGMGLIGQENNDGYRNYHYDFRGSTVALTNENGNVTDTYQYGPYGELYSWSGWKTMKTNASRKTLSKAYYQADADRTPFLYNGQYGIITGSNQLCSMRARHYSIDTRRFISQDTLLGDITNPVSLNRYTYCSSNPVNYMDPSGKESWAGSAKCHLLVQLYYKEFVLEGGDISINLYIKNAGKKPKTWGYADLVSHRIEKTALGKTEIWEVKPDKPQYHTEKTVAQLKRYIHNYPQGATPGRTLEEQIIRYSKDKEIVVRSYTREPGILFYSERTVHANNNEKWEPNPKIEALKRQAGFQASIITATILASAAKVTASAAVDSAYARLCPIFVVPENIYPNVPTI